jgi:hypothetical protein
VINESAINVPEQVHEITSVFGRGARKKFEPCRKRLVVLLLTGTSGRNVFGNGNAKSHGRFPSAMNGWSWINPTHSFKDQRTCCLRPTVSTWFLLFRHVAQRDALQPRRHDAEQDYDGLARYARGGLLFRARQLRAAWLLRYDAWLRCHDVGRLSCDAPRLRV